MERSLDQQDEYHPLTELAAAGPDARPPFVDKHGIAIAAPRERVWAALHHYVDTSLANGRTHPLGRLLGAEPPCGFEVTRDVPARHISLAGRHRFARYLLTFDLSDLAATSDPADPAGGGTLLTAGTYAAFPGPHGRTYRALVIGTRLHVVAVKRMLRTVERRSLRPAGRRVTTNEPADTGREPLDSGHDHA